MLGWSCSAPTDGSAVRPEIRAMPTTAMPIKAAAATDRLDHVPLIDSPSVTQCQTHRGATVTEIEPWFCPTCSRAVATPYCASCGEHPLLARELTCRGLAGQFLQAFTSIDGRLVRSIRCLVGRPGFLTLAYVE